MGDAPCAKLTPSEHVCLGQVDKTIRCRMTGWPNYQSAPSRIEQCREANRFLDPKPIKIKNRFKLIFYLDCLQNECWVESLVEYLWSMNPALCESTECHWRFPNVSLFVWMLLLARGDVAKWVDELLLIFGCTCAQTEPVVNALIIC